MKELSIEEKAKAYDEALKVLHKYDGAHIMFTQDLKEEMFPELREESEDERIRKKLISYFSAVKGFSTLEYNYGITNEEAVAWLEKQGKQPKEFTYTYEAETGNGDTKALVTEKVQRPKFKVGDVLCDKSCTTLNKDAQPNFEIVDIKDGMYICDKDSFLISQQDEYELVAKKIEQKPAWSKEDESFLKTALWHISYSISRGKSTDFHCDTTDWLKSLKDRVQPQLKQEWKQENMDDLTDFENTMMHIGDSFFGQHAGLDPNDTNAIKEQANLLLGLVPKQEWSEEDELNLKQAIYVCHQNGYTAVENWLKSLKDKHTWKPSDEQMDALDDVISKGKLSYINQVRKLISLYNNLKQL